MRRAVLLAAAASASEILNFYAIIVQPQSFDCSSKDRDRAVIMITMAC